MIFRKINKNTIRCVLTESDMEENDIGLEDFFSSNREKIHDFLETIMDEAKQKIGYENDGSVLSMQLMPLPGNGLAITITGSDENDFSGMLGNMQNLLKDMQERLMDGIEEDDGEDCIQPKEVHEITAPACHVYEFDCLSDVEDYCHAVCGYARNLKTSLYKGTKGKYYMEISKGRGSKANYDAACMKASDYAVSMDVSDMFVQYMQEHFERIIPRRVIEKL